MILQDHVAPGYGLLVDGVEDIIEIDDERVERRSGGDLAENQVVAGAYQLPDELLILVDAAAITTIDVMVEEVASSG